MTSAWIPVVGTVLGALLTVAGAWVNSLTAARREERQWRREDERERRRQAREDQAQKDEARQRIYSDLVSKTSLDLFGPPEELARSIVGIERALDEVFTRFLLTAPTDDVRKAGQELYDLALFISRFIQVQDKMVTDLLDQPLGSSDTGSAPPLGLDLRHQHYYTSLIAMGIDVKQIVRSVVKPSTGDEESFFRAKHALAGIRVLQLIQEMLANLMEERRQAFWLAIRSEAAEQH